MNRILITGANGQIGSELREELVKIYERSHVISVDLKKPEYYNENAMGPFELQDVADRQGMELLIDKHHIDTVFHLVGILSAKGERNPELAWNVNVNSLKHILDFAKEKKLRVFWPSSIAVFGPTSPKESTPQATILEPSSMYGLTKVTGELLCNYYCHKYNVDVRSLRFPGLISYKTPPGGGTTDYAVEIFYEAIRHKSYTCFLRKETVLPMMYMPDAIRAILQLMAAPAESLRIRTSYNLTASSFSVNELAEEIKKHIPDFKLLADPDERQKIADSWPKTIDDSIARKDWGWRHEYDLVAMVKGMLVNLKQIALLRAS
ncbi:MAG: NAD-dependent epimerase/dehydratase family protein [bacterium]